MEYLYSQTNKVYEEDVGVDPDIPDGIQDKDLQDDPEGDEGFEDVFLDEPIEFMVLEDSDTQPLQEQTATIQPPGLSTSQPHPTAESSSPALSAQSQVNTHKRNE